VVHYGVFHYVLQFFGHFRRWVIGTPLTFDSLLFDNLDVKGRVFDFQVRLLNEQIEEGRADSDAITGRFHH